MHQGFNHCLLVILADFLSAFYFLEFLVFMRLDKYLKVSRIIKRRTVANEACDAGKVSVNGNVARASTKVKEGDRIDITLGERTVSVEVVSVKETVRKEDATTLYKPIS